MPQDTSGVFPVSGVHSDLLELGRSLGSTDGVFAMLGEGNVSARVDESTMAVKASGSSLADLQPHDVVDVHLAAVLDLIRDAPQADDVEVKRVLAASLVDSDARHPSVETLLHAVALNDGGAAFVAHTHPISVNAILCSNRANALVDGALFPDQIVVMGRRQLLIPYTDPGLDLSRRVADELKKFIELYGECPKVIYLQNHGLFVLGGTSAEVLQITRMVNKVAAILGAALAIGEPSFLTEVEADRIHNRPDELHRRNVLAIAASAER